jgi:hypothetical protein
MTKDKKLWGGRFEQGTAPLVEEYTCSVDYDRNLYRQDIAGSRAHAAMLARQGVLTDDEAALIIEGLGKVAEEIESGGFTWRPDMEDVHMNIEHRLTEIIGPAGQKLHTGRSRNDQVGIDFRLFVRDALDSWSAALHDLVQGLTEQAEKNTAVLLPGCTHLQPAQPVSLAHHLLAYVQMFRRDFERVRDCRKRMSVSPLGAAALAGTTYPIDPASTAAELGLDSVFQGQRGHDAPESAVRGDHHLGQPRVRVRAPARRVRHGLVHHAPEKESRRGRAHAGQDRPGLRRPDRPADHHEGHAPGLQPGHAGGQGALFRRGQDRGHVRDHYGPDDPRTAVQRGAHV